MSNEDFNTIRRNAEITSAELADFMGTCRSQMFRVETGREVVAPSMVSALHAMIAARA
jgi:DNA-binding XRE family transcriptional regulator